MSYRAEIQKMLDTMPPDWRRQWSAARQQLRALDYDAPARPDVADATAPLFLTAGGRESGDRVKGTVPVPARVRDEAMHGLRLAHRHNYGAWNFIGIARAIQLATVPSIDTRSVERMAAFFSRHGKDARARGFGDDVHPSRGYLAHLVWGGDAGKAWASTKRNPAPTRRTKPDLWAKVLAKVTAGSKGGRPGQWSARKAQLAVAEYRRLGGEYFGPKDPKNALVKWTREKWRTRSGRPSLETGERYLPEAAVFALSPQEYGATTRAKRAGMSRGEQFVPQPERIARKTAKYRKAKGKTRGR